MSIQIARAFALAAESSTSRRLMGTRRRRQRRVTLGTLPEEAIHVACAEVHDRDLRSRAVRELLLELRRELRLACTIRPDDGYHSPPRVPGADQKRVRSVRSVDALFTSIPRGTDSCAFAGTWRALRVARARRSTSHRPSPTNSGHGRRDANPSRGTRRRGQETRARARYVPQGPSSPEARAAASCATTSRLNGVSSARVGAPAPSAWNRAGLVPPTECPCQ